MSGPGRRRDDSELLGEGGIGPAVPGRVIHESVAAAFHVEHCGGHPGENPTD
jgi:hypothetical protein